MNDANRKPDFSHDGANNLRKMFPLIEGYHSPRVIGEVNDVFVKITKVKGDDVPWHTHANEDELFYMVKGCLEMEIDEHDPFTLQEGELFIVKKGLQHRVSSEDECWILLIEHKSTEHTGGVQSSITKSIDEQL
jgi:quercetin dioxygenase-like cupin family protein